jgi:hypothetical protein
VALMLFSMRVELARARALEGFRADDEDLLKLGEVLAREFTRAPGRSALQLSRAGMAAYVTDA